MWTRTDFENAATKIGKDFVDGGGETSINDLATKVAEDGKLNPDGIRTVVRLANVSVFENLFSKAASDGASDRMLEFAVGDPEVVINKLHKDAQVTHEVKQADDYNQSADFYGDMPKEVTPLEKTASAIPGMEVQEAVPVPISKAQARLQFKRADDRMREQGQQAKAYWTDKLEKAAQCLLTLDSRIMARTQFEKNALASLGADVLPELFMVRSLTSPGNPKPDAVCGGEKIATVLQTHVAVPPKEHVPIIAMIKEASDARHFYDKCKQGRDWIASNMDKVN